MNRIKLIALFASVAFIAGCESEPETRLQDSIVEATPATDGALNPRAVFDPSGGLIPFPNNLLFSGTADLTLNIPVTDATDFSDPAVAMNALDGFSTVAPMSSSFTTDIDSSTINGASVKLYEATLFASQTQPIAGPVVGVTALTFGVDYIAAVSGASVVVLPINKPLKASTSYMVVITDDLKDQDGNSFAPSITYSLLKSLVDTPLTFGDTSIPGSLQSLSETSLASFEGLRLIINTSEATVAASDADVEVADIIQSWSFTTQSTATVLATVRAVVGTPTSTLAASTVDQGFGAGAGKSPAGAANVFEGTLDNVPYYLTVPSESNPTAQLSSPWQAANALGGENNLTNVNPLPAATTTVSIPLLITTPADTATFPAPWKTVIFQHGITQARNDVMAVADTLAAVGFAVVAIDLPLHGIDPGAGFYQEGKERTFEVDFVTQTGETITAAAPDGTVDTTGAHYVNFSNLLVLRDNLRQATSDLFALTAAIPGMDVDGGGADLDANNIYFVGHSLGASVSMSFLALETNVKDAVLAFGGTQLTKTMDGSTVFSPQLVGGLAQSGVTKGTADYEAFLGAAQTVIDSADPVNYSELAAASRGILFFEMIPLQVQAQLQQLH